ncbi:prepilin-type N-terminal cleavage/methylation domain-containing protein [Candidatus Saccharibacteria bacterium]|nr:MAG: prepilin-type N-terminal cleavage/methylation domain-containing protein [Candidatus Saccharibacteria bacterium]
MQKSRTGFTIIELVVVVIVVSILATIVVVSYNGSQARARDARRRTDVANIVKALELYYNDNGSYPTTSGSTAMTINWFSSNDASWSTFNTALVNSNAITSLPVDPLNVPSSGAANTGVSFGTGNYSYALYVNKLNYCGSAPGQMYLLLYRLESEQAQPTFTDGSCASNELGSGYGTAYYRSVK